jgi:hypothetical protein
MNVKALAANYFEQLKLRSTEGLKDVFTPDLYIQTPIGEWRGLDSFLNEIERNRWNLTNLNLKKLVQEGEDKRLLKEQSELNEYKEMPRKIQNPANYNVFGDTVITQIFEEEPTIIQIKNQNTADAYM